MISELWDSVGWAEVNSSVALKTRRLEMEPLSYMLSLQESEVPKANMLASPIVLIAPNEPHTVSSRDMCLAHEASVPMY